MNREKVSFRIVCRNIMWVGVACVFSLILTPRAGYADNAGAHEKFQAIFNNAWHSMLREKLANRKRVPLDVAPGEKVLMNCSPEKFSSQDTTFTISFGNMDIPKSFSLVFVNEYQQVLAIAANSYGTPTGSYETYIGDNTIQPEHIKKNATVTTDPSLTYGHMDDTGYPFAAFGPSGTYAILLVDDAINFQMGHKARGHIVADHGKIPNVIAGCVVSWTLIEHKFSKQ